MDKYKAKAVSDEWREEREREMYLCVHILSFWEVLRYHSDKDHMRTLVYRHLNSKDEQLGQENVEQCNLHFYYL